jgi:hypothetical protein
VCMPVSTENDWVGDALTFDVLPTNHFSPSCVQACFLELKSTSVITHSFHKTLLIQHERVIGGGVQFLHV